MTNNKNYKILYVQKALSSAKNKNGIFGIASVINKSLEYLKDSEITIFLSPGYLGTSKETRELLTNKVFKDNNYTQLIDSISILNVMNYKYKSKYESELKGPNFRLNVNILPVNNIQDHRKMIFICKVTSPEDYKKWISVPNNKQKKDIIKGISKSLKVCGYSIGSSNFSKTSYLVPVGNNSNKDEADVFIYNTKYINNSVFEQNIEGFTSDEIPEITSFTIDQNLNDDYLNKILEKTLDGILM